MNHQHRLLSLQGNLPLFRILEHRWHFGISYLLGILKSLNKVSTCPLTCHNKDLHLSIRYPISIQAHISFDCILAFLKYLCSPHWQRMRHIYLRSILNKEHNCNHHRFCIEHRYLSLQHHISKLNRYSL